MAYKRNLLWQGPHNIMEFWSGRIEFDGETQSFLHDN